MDGVLAAGTGTLKGPVRAGQVDHSATDPRRFAMLLIPLALLLVTFKVYRLEQPAFFVLACLMFGGFAVSYWLPFQYKETFFILLSLGGAYVLLSPAVATLLIAAGLLLFAISRSRLEFRWRVLILLGILGVLAYARATEGFHIPSGFWPVFGAVFVVRAITFLYDAKHMPAPIRLKDFLSYFFLLPNYYFFFFPIIDYQTFRKSYFKRDIHLVAQQGVWWIFRGTTHLLLYRFVYQLQSAFSPPKVPVAMAVGTKIVLSYLLYLRISGQFHIIVGMLLLFGYDLPETNRRYWLASGINDFWRRANIYWKDFMVKVFYFPAYFKMRRKGDLRAQLLATVFVIVVTWFLHAYLFFWVQGQFRVTYNDSLFWIILGCLMLANVWFTNKHAKRRPASGRASTLMKALRIAGTFATISILWSLWSAEGIQEWLYFLKSGNI